MLKVLSSAPVQYTASSTQSGAVWYRVSRRMTAPTPPAATSARSGRGVFTARQYGKNHRQPTQLSSPFRNAGRLSDSLKKRAKPYRKASGSSW